MKQFSLEEYLKNPNKKVIIRSGLPVRIVCTDMKSIMPIIALLPITNDEEAVYYYYPNGRYCSNVKGGRDLMFASIKKKGWVNLFKNNSTIITGEVYNTEAEAKSAILCKYTYISTAKIEWEE